MRRIEGIKLDVPGVELKSLFTDLAERYRVDLAQRRRAAQESCDAHVEAGLDPPDVENDEILDLGFAAMAEQFGMCARWINADATYLLDGDFFWKLADLAPEVFMDNVVGACTTVGDYYYYPGPDIPAGCY